MEPSVAIYWEDLTEKAQKEIKEVISDVSQWEENGFPLCVIEMEDGEFVSG